MAFYICLLSLLLFANVFTNISKLRTFGKLCQWWRTKFKGSHDSLASYFPLNSNWSVCFRLKKPNIYIQKQGEIKIKLITHPSVVYKPKAVLQLAYQSSISVTFTLSWKMLLVHWATHKNMTAQWLAPLILGYQRSLFRALHSSCSLLSPKLLSQLF